MNYTGTVTHLSGFVCGKHNNDSGLNFLINT